MDLTLSHIVPWADGLWNSWGIQILVLGSLILQLILTILGSQRKYIKSIWIELVVWLSYVMGNWVATFALSKLIALLGNFDGEDGKSNDDALVSLWGCLLLLHLGGPDTITANSLGDVRFWLRHLLGLGLHSAMAIYILIKSWSNESELSLLAIPMFIAGIIKYGERTWALKSGYSDPRGTYTETSEKAPGSEGSDPRGTCPETSKKQRKRSRRIPTIIDEEEQLLDRSYSSFKLFYPYVANQVGYISLDPFSEVKPKTIVKLIERELRFIYDVLYTKSFILHSKLGRILRSLSILCLVTVLVGFSIIIKNMNGVEHHYRAKMFIAHPVNIHITYVLLGSAVFLEVCAVTMAICSDWGTYWLRTQKRNWIVSKVHNIVAFMRRIFSYTERMSNSVRQYNLLSVSIIVRKSRTLRIMPKLFRIYMTITEQRCITYEDFPVDKRQDLVERIRKVDPEEFELFNKKLEWQPSNRSLPGSLRVTVYDSAIIMMHIITEIIYNTEFGIHGKLDQKSKTDMDMSKILSDYMMYLVVHHPYMLRIAPGRSKQMIVGIFEEMKHSGIDYFQISRNDKTSPNLAEALLNLQNLGDLKETKNAIYQAKTLLSLPNKWEIISGMWVEMLCYGAAQCQMIHHTECLAQGGELLTHVWLYLAHKSLADNSELALEEEDHELGLAEDYP